MADALIKTRVVRRQQVAADIIALELRAANGRLLPSFTAGAHLDVHIEDGLVRQYSLVNDEIERDRYVIAVQRMDAGRGGSSTLHKTATEGALLNVGAPRNHFALARDDAPVLLLAGGIGVTPLLAMARVLVRQSRSFKLLYSVASRDRAAFADDLLDAPLRSAMQLYETRREGGGRIDLNALAHGATEGTRVYACGPHGFVTDVAEAFARRPDIDISSERFSGPAGGEEGGAFSVRLARSGVEFEVPEGRSILDELRHLGIEPDVSCEQGVCGTCQVDVLDGTVEHQDFVLSPAERATGRSMLICVSRGRPGSLLVLDL